MFEIGQKICVLNIDNEPDYGTIIFIEPDNEIGVLWLYLKSDVDSMNTNTDPKIQGLYWRVIESSSDKLFLAD